jgi:hypothetical protein
MIDSFIVHPTVRQRLREGSLGPAVDDLAQALRAQGYAAATIRIYLRTSVHFGQWLTQHHIPVASITNATVDQYLRHLWSFALWTITQSRAKTARHSDSPHQPMHE